ncbi:TPA_asm: hypothetical protein GDL74_17930 [Salmonella enterica]|nr:Uncharacterised protein [Salmonella enterica subsp. arizonae]HAA0720495.1 hypothetical protein [Salmonella enterica]
MTAVTDLQKQRQQDQAQTNLDAAQGYSVTPNQGSVVPNVMQAQKIYEAMLAQKNSIPNIEPPSEGEIRRESWIASGVMGLLGALVTGNPASGIAIGMQAALALHDHGYDLRQRAEHVGELHQQGYSALAIEKWYETGDNSELDKERQNMEAMARDEVSLQMQGLKMDQQNDQFNKRMDQQDKQFDLQNRRLDQMAQHEGVMENIALQNAASARMAAIVKMGAQAGQQMATPGASGGAPGVQLASFNPNSVQVPAQITDPQEKAAYIAAVGQAYHGQMLKDMIGQVSAAKNLRTSESQQTAMFDKILEAAQKVAHTPANKAGDEQLLMQFQVGESPNVSPRTTQIDPLMKSLTTGRVDAAENWLNRKTGGGLTESEREQARDLTRSNAQAQAESHMEHVKNVVTTNGFDLSNPEVMRDLVAAFHVSPETITGLSNGSLTPQQAAKDAIDKVAPKTTDFGDVPEHNAKATSGAW